MSRFQEKVTFVTGAASGIGRSTCLRLGSEGAQVYGVDVDAEGLAETARLVAAAGGTVETSICNVTNRAGCFESIAACVAKFGKLDVLANVAGVVRFSHATETSEDEWNLLLAVNLSGPFFLSQAAIPHLLETKGNIVNIASNAGLMGQAYTVGYCASKAGLINMSKALAMEFVKSDIRINCVAPSGTATSLVANVQFPSDPDGSLIDRYRGFRAMSQPEDIVNVVAFLASDEAKAVHGAVWAADQAVSAG
ncbi:MAG: SDR family NAD(P)-dependent oxidoreductase [Candidatus Binatia bacterium]|nr:SDR family NAD(P)-dependent oxidoreductase [Candidatus Binatia bacterium]